MRMVSMAVVACLLCSVAQAQTQMDAMMASAAATQRVMLDQQCCLQINGYVTPDFWGMYAQISNDPAINEANIYQSFIYASECATCFVAFQSARADANDLWRTAKAHLSLAGTALGQANWQVAHTQALLAIATANDSINQADAADVWFGAIQTRYARMVIIALD